MSTKQFMEYYGEAGFIEVLESKLIFHEAKDLSDSEIERCLKDCVLGHKLIIACKEIRAKLNWKRILSGQKKYQFECDYAPIQPKGQLQLF